jgi:hypothetical protein
MNLDNIRQFIKQDDGTESIQDIEKPEFPDISKGFNTAFKEMHYPQIDMKWEYGSNTLVGEEIWERSFTTLEFLPSTSIKEVIQPDIDEEYKTNSFYLVRFPFLEYEYKATKPFFEWDLSVNKYIHEELFYRKKSSSIRWDRPFNTYINPNSDTEIKYYLPLSLPFIKEFVPNKALGFQVRSDSTFVIESNQIVYPSNELITPAIESQYNITFPYISNQTYSNYISIRQDGDYQYEDLYHLVNGNASPTYIEIDLWGLDKIPNSKRIIPNGEDYERQEILIHPSNTPLEQRLKPPNTNFDDSGFWNMESPTNYKDIVNYYDRKSKDSSLS